jgi:hypothetical protein
VPHRLWHGVSVFSVSSEGPPHLVAFYDTPGDVENLFLPGSSWVAVTIFVAYTRLSIFPAIHNLDPDCYILIIISEKLVDRALQNFTCRSLIKLQVSYEPWKIWKTSVTDRSGPMHREESYRAPITFT